MHRSSNIPVNCWTNRDAGDWEFAPILQASFLAALQVEGGRIHTGQLLVHLYVLADFPTQVIVGKHQPLERAGKRSVIEAGEVAYLHSDSATCAQ
eukprot:1161712-Pelagomonas_calceolata.AAC.5